jgi:alpha-N-arabinofuranosidase
VPGTPYVDIPANPIGSSTYPLDVLAAFSSDRKTFLVSVVNPTLEGQAFTPQINGVKLRGQGKLSQIAPASVDAVNEVGKEPAVRINEIAQASLNETVQIPPFSVSVYEFDVA